MEYKMSCRIRGFYNRIFIVLALGFTAFLPLRSAPAAEYLIQPDDVLSIQVSGEPSLTRNYTVNEDGDVTMETAGKVHFAGLTVKQAESELTQKLKAYLKLFEVNINLVGETGGGRILVFGEVARPGSVKVRSESKLLDVLAEAGQPTLNADSKRISVIRKDGKVETIDLEAVLKDQSLNIKLYPGDTVTVPSRTNNAVFIDGEVRTPGLRSLDQFKTAYALVLSAGPTENSDWKRILLRRKESKLPLVIDLSPVQSGQMKDDLELQPGDQVTVSSRYRGTATLRGEVKDPGEKPLTDRTKLLDFIRVSGGGSPISRIKRPSKSSVRASRHKRSI
jgi:polysaccharide biosynthesis/export protein